MTLHSEIFEQPERLASLLENQKQTVMQIAKAIQSRNVSYAFLAARGTSDNAGRYANYLWGARNQLPLALATPSLFTYYQKPPRLQNALVVGVSQSGQSPDIVSVVEEGRKQNNITVAITNEPDSPLAKAADFVLDVQAGPEKAVAATKTYTAELMSIAMLSAALNDLDTVGAAKVLAAAIQKIGADMVVFGRQTLDNGAGLTPAQTARVLGWPMLGLAGQIKVDGGSVQVERVLEEGRQSVKASMPAVLSVVQSIGEPRYPSFMGIRKASKANIPVWSLNDIGASAPAPMITRTELMTPPVRDTAVEMIAGETPAEIAEKLADKIIAEKVL